MSNKPFRIFLLGRFLMVYRKQKVDVPRRDTFTRVFSFLLFHPHQEIRRDKLAFRVWPDSPEEKALANLRRHLYLIRESLPAACQGWLKVSRFTVSWQPDDRLSVDALDFDRLVPDDDAPEADMDTLRQAVELYQGDLLEDILDDEFVLMQRERLRGKLRAALSALVEDAQRREDTRRGLSYAEKLAALEPWDEEAARRLMALQYASGRRAEALRVFAGLRAQLEQELGTLPTAETMDLYTAILHNRQLTPPDPYSSTPSAPFVGRERELGILAEAFADLRMGQGRIVQIRGAAGVGKSRLVREALLGATGQDDLLWVVQTHCGSELRDEPYGLWVEVFARLFAAILRSQPEQGPSLAQAFSPLLPLIPDLATLLPDILPPMIPDAGQIRAAIRHALRLASQFRRLVLVIEDLHWADAPSLAALEEIAAAHPLPILILATRRAGSGGGVLGQSQISPSWRPAELTLKPLDREEVLAWIGIASKTPLPGEALRDLVDEVFAISEGNPLMVVELLRQIQTRKQTRELAGLPPSLEDVLRERMGGLEAELRRLLEAAATLGAKFNHATLQELVGWEGSRFNIAIERLLDLDFIRPLYSSIENDYAFDHHLTSSLIHEQTTPGRRAEWHRRAGAAVLATESGWPGSAMRAAQHYELGAQPLDAARQWLRHAEEAARLCSHQSTLDACGKVLSLAAGPQEDELALRAQAWLRSAEAHYSLGDNAAAHADLEEVGLLLAQLQSDALDCDRSLHKAFLYYTVDDYQKATDEAGRALEAARRAGDADRQAQALNYLALSNMMLGRLQEARDGLRASLDLLEREGLNGTGRYIQTLDYFGTVLMFLQNYREALAIKMEVIERAQKAGLIRVEAGARMILGQILLDLGQYRGAISYLDEAIHLGQDTFSPGLLGKYVTRGVSYWRLGDLKRAGADFLQGLEISRRAGTPYGVALCSGYVYCLGFWTGISASGELTYELRALLGEEHVGTALGPPLYVVADFLCRLWLMANDLDQARRFGELALKAAEATQVERFMMGASLRSQIVQAYCAPTRQTLSAIGRLRKRAMGHGHNPMWTESLLAEGEVLLRMGEHEKAFRSLHPAIRQAREFEDKGLLIEALVHTARAEQASGDEEAAEQQFREAVSLAAEYARCYLPWIESLQKPGADSRPKRSVIRAYEQLGILRSC